MVFGGETPESYYDEGVTASIKGDVAEAIRCFERAVELDKDFLGAYHQLGKCYLRLGDTARALQYIEHVVRTKPNQVPPRVDLGYALLDAGNVLKARQLFQEVLSLKPDNQRTLLGLAICAFQEGEWDAATDLAQNAVAMGNTGFPAQYLLGRAAKFAQRDAAALEALEAAEAFMNQSIEATPDQPEGYYLRGCIRFVRDAFPDAIEDFRSAESKSEPNRHYSAYGEHFTHTDVLGRLGLCLQRIGKADKAREIGEKILAVDPENRTGKVLTQE